MLEIRGKIFKCGGGTHEHGDWEVVGWGQEKVFKLLLKWGTRSKKKEENWGYYSTYEVKQRVCPFVSKNKIQDYLSWW